jgi:glutamyl-tRNA synthetase
VFSPAELVAAFDITAVKANPARFDAKKCLAINATHIRLLAPDDFADRLAEYAGRAGFRGEHVRAVVSAAAPLVQERVQTLVEAVDMINFLLVDEADFTLDEAASAKVLDAGGRQVVAAALAALEPVSDWRAPAIEEVLKAALVDGLGLKPRHAFGPVRVAVTGRTVSPPLFESMEMLGRDRALARLRRAA